MERIENRTVNETVWRELESQTPDEIRYVLKQIGYREICTDVFVPEQFAFDYALDHCVKDEPWRLREIEWTDEFKKMLVEWYYSDSNWIKED